MATALTSDQRCDLYLAVAFGGLLNITENVQTLHELGYLKQGRKSAFDNDVWLVPTRKAKALFSGKGKLS